MKLQDNSTKAVVCIVITTLKELRGFGPLANYADRATYNSYIHAVNGRDINERAEEIIFI
jgi:hypothetical protein